MIRKLVAILGIMLWSLSVSAGVTIHYSGTVESDEQAEKILNYIEQYADEKGWAIRDIRGGVTVLPDEWCEPINIVFEGQSLREDFVKTQFAGPAIHRDIVLMFRGIADYTSTLNIGDEGEYWDTNDIEKLSMNMKSVEIMMENIKKQQAGVKGPSKLPNGRIIDLHR